MSKKCNLCEKTIKKYNFYKSKSIMFSDGLVPICKKCLKDSVEEGNMDSLKDMLRRIDKPFIASVWLTAEKSDENAIGKYMSMLNSLQQYRDKTWNDSDFEKEEESKMFDIGSTDVNNTKQLETEDGVIELTKDVVAKFGGGYTNLEYLQMKKFYNDMEMTHNLSTPQLKRAVVNMCKIQVQMDRSLSEGNAGDYKKYSDAYEKMLDSSALAPKVSKTTDEAQGIRNFSQCFAEVEKNGNVKPVHISERKDLVDLTILAHLNYIRVLKGHGRLSEVPEEIQKVFEGREDIIHD